MFENLRDYEFDQERKIISDLLCTNYKTNMKNYNFDWIKFRRENVNMLIKSHKLEKTFYIPLKHTAFKIDEKSKKFFCNFCGKNNLHPYIHFLQVQNGINNKSLMENYKILEGNSFQDAKNKRNKSQFFTHFLNPLHQIEVKDNDVQIFFRQKYLKNLTNLRGSMKINENQSKTFFIQLNNCSSIDTCCNIVGIYENLDDFQSCAVKNIEMFFKLEEQNYYSFYRLTQNI